MEPTDLLSPGELDEELSNSRELDNEEESEDGEETDEILSFTVEGPRAIYDLIQIVLQHSKDMLPLVDGKRYVHPHQLDYVLERIRHLFWNHPRIETQYDFRRFIVERLPLGSILTLYGYITLDKYIILNEIYKALYKL